MPTLPVACEAAPSARPVLVELHCHIEGSFSPAFLTGQVARYGADPALADAFWRAIPAFRWSEPRAWLKTMQTITQQCLRCPDDYEALFSQYFAAMAEGGVCYAEPSIALDRCAMSGMDLSAVLLGAGRAMAAAEARWEMRSGLLLALDYRMSVDDCFAHIDLATDVLPGRLVGIDLQGMPSCPRARFGEVFQYARAHGLGTRAHVGEFEGPRSVWEAIEVLGVDRIAHGVRAVTDATLMARLARDQIALDMSIGSNVSLGVVAGWEQHPVLQFIECGIPVSLSTDDPLFFSVSPAAEYQRASVALGLSTQEVAGMQRIAIAHSFAPDAVKQQLFAAAPAFHLQGVA